MTVYLSDVISSMELIERYTTKKTYSDFINDLELHDAVIRRLTVIGEATSRLTRALRNKYPKIQWKAIIGLRNIIIHNYDNVKLEEIWKIVRKDLPKTKKLIEKIKKDLIKKE